MKYSFCHAHPCTCTGNAPFSTDINNVNYDMSNYAVFITTTTLSPLSHRHCSSLSHPHHCANRKQYQRLPVFLFVFFQHAKQASSGGLGTRLPLPMQAHFSLHLQCAYTCIYTICYCMLITYQAHPNMPLPLPSKF